MSTDQLFAMKIERIKHLAREAYETARMFNGFNYHQPSMEYLDAKAAAASARLLAVEIDKLADKIAPAEQMQAAE